MPNVGRSPVQPHRVEGDEIDPSVSDPIANPTHPAATAARRARRRSARPLRRIPRIARPPAKPLVAHRQRAQRELRNQHSARRIQPLHHRRVLIKRLVLEPARAPSRRIAFHRQQILRAPRNPVQRPAILPRRNLCIRFFACASARSSVSVITKCSLES